MKHPSPEGAPRVDVEAEPPEAAALFGVGAAQASAFAADLVRFGEALGLIGPLELPRLWTRHVLNCVTLAPLLRPGRVGDIGSGAGLPGLVLAIARPDCELVLIEPMERRVEWLVAESARLGLSNVTVERARAEESSWTGRLDQVTARAVSALGKLGPLAATLVRPGGELLLLKGARVQDEFVAAERALVRAGLIDPSIELLGEGSVPEPTWLFRATRRA